MRLFAASVMVMLFLVCCSESRKPSKQDTDDLDEELPAVTPVVEDLPKGAEVLFDDFMFNFASDRSLQLRRIMFPLSITRSEHVEHVDTGQWSMEPFFMDRGEYTLIFDTQEQMELVNDTTVSMAVVEKIYLEADSVRQYLFNRQDGRWKLVEVRLQSVDDNVNASFLEFYRRFVTDSMFRQNSLCDEIAFSFADPEDDFGQMEGFITPDSWEAFAPSLPKDSIYNIVYGEQDANARQKIFIIRGIGNEQDMELTFLQEHGRWKLSKLTE